MCTTVKLHDSFVPPSLSNLNRTVSWTIFLHTERGMLRGSEMTYDFNCGAIAEANNRSPGNVQQHLQFNVFRKVTHLAAWDNRCKMEGKHNDRDSFAGN